ncbi:MAG: type I phosphomannose isomerase catalytic subunit [Planctomycetota bacterium]
MTGPCVLPLRPILKEKVWGGRRLEAYGKRLPSEGSFGESWELADLATTSASGGGGDAALSVVDRGPLEGVTLREAIAQWGDDLLGDATLSAEGGFPLLVKLLDAREHLSVQAHPSPGYAEAHEGAHLKTECWFVLRADEGPRGEPPVIYKGLKPGVGPEELRAAIAGGGVPEVLHAVPAAVGELHDVPSGTVHALGAGVLVAEVQTPSDTTYRLYDWNEQYGRPQREMHLEQGVAAAVFEDPPAPSRAPSGDGLHELVSNAFYRVSLLRGAHEIASPMPVVLMAIDGEAHVQTEGASESLAHGETALIPACLASTVHTEGAALIATVG